MVRCPHRIATALSLPFEAGSAFTLDAWALARSWLDPPEAKLCDDLEEGKILREPGAELTDRTGSVVRTRALARIVRFETEEQCREPTRPARASVTPRDNEDWPDPEDPNEDRPGRRPPPVRG